MHIKKLKSLFLQLASTALLVFLFSCFHKQSSYYLDAANVDSIILVQVNHPYVGEMLGSMMLKKNLISEFLQDFDAKSQTVVKFYSCYIIKTYYKNGESKSYRTNGHLLEKFEDDKTQAVYFEFKFDQNIITKYWGIKQEDLCKRY